MRSVSLMVMVLLLVSTSAAPARGQTPGPVTPQVAPRVDLSGVIPPRLSGDRLAEFETYVTDMLAKTGVPGASVAVVQNGEVIYQQGFGVRELGDRHRSRPTR